MSQYLPQREVLQLSQLHKGGQDKKHYPTSQDLLLISLFPYLKSQILAKQRLICGGHPLVLTPAAPGQLACTLSAKHPLLFANG